LHDDGKIYSDAEGGALYGDINSDLLFDSLDDFLASHDVISIMSEDGYTFAVTDDGVTNGDMSFDSLQSAIEALQS
jgi:predicted transcriptional regulator